MKFACVGVFTHFTLFYMNFSNYFNLRSNAYPTNSYAMLCNIYRGLKNRVI